MGQYTYTALSTSLGWIGVLGSDSGIRQLALPQPSASLAVERLKVPAGGAETQTSSFEELRLALEAYFAGEPTTFQQPLDLDGTAPFFQRAWEACRSIPRGETRTYAWLAREAGSPAAVRAAGQAMARNPVPIIIPCHRVVGSDGSLCGYGGGLALKRRLLDLEQGERSVA
jgi:methylated-DNA-[protein]-cysteine S-methyltransferase